MRILCRSLWIIALFVLMGKDLSILIVAERHSVVVFAVVANCAGRPGLRFLSMAFLRR